jgi:hypothetical protein
VPVTVNGQTITVDLSTVADLAFGNAITAIAGLPTGATGDGRLIGTDWYVDGFATWLSTTTPTTGLETGMFAMRVGQNFVPPLLAPRAVPGGPPATVPVKASRTLNVGALVAVVAGAIILAGLVVWVFQRRKGRGRQAPNNRQNDQKDAEISQNPVS